MPYGDVVALNGPERPLLSFYPTLSSGLQLLIPEDKIDMDRQLYFYVSKLMNRVSRTIIPCSSCCVGQFYTK